MNVCDQPGLPAVNPRRTKSGRVLTAAEIEKIRAANRQWHRNNKERSRVRHQAWRAANGERVSHRRRAYSLWNLHGLTIAQYEALGNACTICGATRGANNRRLHVDHDHATGVIRGLLCSPCNTALGLLKEDPELFTKAVAYLERHRSAVA